eukprot:TRINITY_DN2250_c0_g1_i2.p1 TRINITY_DN2250_c0_g1~~TRINITY_DN2250_c0_g1_i2.p1  ORF type:complete len:543 (-),score=77.04 TRINITY_DN2250_c0_g1_i2:212-1840(-)
MGRSRSRTRSPSRRRQRARSGPRRQRAKSRSSPSRSPSRRRRRTRSPSRRRQRQRSASSPRRGGRGGGAGPDGSGDAPSRIFVAHSDCAKIIGRKGETRMDIERFSDASIKIQREEDMDQDKKERWVDIIGNARQRAAALTRIMDIASFVRDEDGKVLKDGPSSMAGAGEALVLMISCNEVGRILGRGGETIRRLEDESRARIEIDKGEGRLTVSGRQEAIERAKGLILMEVSHCKLPDGTVLKDEGRPSGPGGGPPLASGRDAFKLWVLGKEAGKVIGRGGETVREIMQRTGAEIQVERTENREMGQAERLVQIFGSKSQMEEAFRLIIKDVSFTRTELGVAKSPEMQGQEVEDKMRAFGPGGNGILPPPFSFPPGPGLLPPGHPPLMSGLPPPGMMPAVPPPGMTFFPGMPPFPPPGTAPAGMTLPGTMPGMPSPPGMTFPAGMPPPPGHLPPFPPSNGMPPGIPPGMHPPVPGMPPGAPGFGAPPIGKGRSRSRESSASSDRGKRQGWGPPEPFMLPVQPYVPPDAPIISDKPIDWDDL